METGINLPHVADTLVADADMNAPFTREELCSNLRRLFSDKATEPDGISNRMLQLGGIQFQTLLFFYLRDVWRERIYPDQWVSSLQPLYKGDGKDRKDPASYRGIFLSSAILKLFEGILESRLKDFKEKAGTLTPRHFRHRRRAGA